MATRYKIISLKDKASGNDCDTGTDDDKFVTVKAINDSHNVPMVAPGTSGNVLTSNGTDWTSAAPSGGSFTPSFTYSTIFETLARFDTTGGGGVKNMTTTGLFLDTTTTGGTYAILKLPNVTNHNIFAGSPSFNFRFSLPAVGTTTTWFVGIGDATEGVNTAINGLHVGFVVRVIAGVASLHATNANGTSETLSSALATISANDVVEVATKINGTTSISYYWRVNGAAWSTVTSHTTNIPNATTTNFLHAWAVNTTGRLDGYVHSFSYSR